MEPHIITFAIRYDETTEEYIVNAIEYINALGGFGENISSAILDWLVQNGGEYNLGEIEEVEE